MIKLLFSFNSTNSFFNCIMLIILIDLILNVTLDTTTSEEN